jgi:hypothetical protein
MRQRLVAMRAGWALLIANAVLAVLDVPYAALGLMGTAILALLLTIRFSAARALGGARYRDGSASTDSNHGSWVSDAFGWTALSAAHDAHHHSSGDDDHHRKAQAGSSESSGGFFSFFSDSSSSDSGSSSGGSDYSSSDGGSSDSGSSDSGSSSSSSD